LLEVNEIDVFYGAFQALRDLSIRVGDGESVGLFGPNGHGKTTILKTISGLLTPQTGSIVSNGAVISGVSPENIVHQGIIHVLQGSHLFSEMTVLENLALGAYVPSAWAKREENLAKVFELFPGLKGRKHQRCSTLSGGERQMVAIGRGLMSDAHLLMLDEPFLGLAPKLSEEIMQRIVVIKETGMSMIVVEQNVAYVTRLSDRLYLIEEGEVSLEGNKEDILANEYVKDAYLGLIEQVR